MSAERYVWDICEYSQKLISGAWGSPDCEWDWETDHTEFQTEEEARAAFDRLTVSDDTPIIRLFKVPCVRDYAYKFLWVRQHGDAELLAEKA